MEYCKGETLGKLLGSEKVLPSNVALDIVTQVVRGLEHAHKSGIIHRDIKPDNIFIADDPAGSIRRPSGAKGIAKILDLGLSKNISEEKQSFYTQTGVVMGTAHYISPEQARGDKSIDGRADIYSLGATFYHLVTGQTPFSGTTAGVVMMKHLSEQLPNPQDLREDIPDGIVQVIQKMMAKDVADRYRDCAELLADLALLKQGRMPASAGVDAARSTIALRAPRRVPPPLAGGGRGRAERAKRDRGEGVARRGTKPIEVADTVVPQSGGLRHVPHSAGLRKPQFGKMRYIAIGALALGVLILVLALMQGGGGDKSGNQAVSTSSAPSIPSIPSTPDADAAAAQPDAGALPKEMALDLGGGVKMEMVLVPAGEFTMGSDNEGGNEEKPAHKVKISKPFYLGKFVVTQEQYEAVIRKNPAKFKAPKNPVEQVRWNEAQEFCKVVSQKAGKTVRLPTEAEWEYACRAGTRTKFNLGDKGSDLEQAAWFNENSGEHTNPVGQKKPNAWGLYDMHGNVWQWVQDYFNDEYYADSPPVDPKGPANGDDRVVRGGAWNYGPVWCRAARRHWYTPGVRNADVGFRVALDVPAAAAPVALQPPTSPAQPDAGALPKVMSLDLGGGVKMDFALIPAGEFQMGEKGVAVPVHPVKITKPFYLGKYVVTQAQYEKVVGTNPSSWKGQDSPVNKVSWEDAQGFCKTASKLTGRRFKLPTEAQWEYACRAGTTTEYNTGQGEAALDKAGWYGRNSGTKTHPVGKKAPNAWGLYDMHGNVREWCEDWFGDKYYAESVPADPPGPTTGKERVLRAGAFVGAPGECLSAFRRPWDPGNRDDSVGFRVALDLSDYGPPLTVQPPTPPPQPEPAVHASNGATQLGGCKLLSKFGMGAKDADVFVAEHPRLHEKVLLEELPRWAAGNTAFRESLVRLAKTLGTLRHPNIVAFLDVDQQDGVFFTISEYHEGESLSALLQREKVLPWQRAVGIAADLAAGLKCVHENHIVHRGINPGRVVIAKDGTAMIFRFSIALDLNKVLSQEFPTAGVADSMPPEQWRGDKIIDGRADIYALGATFWEMLAGAPPYGHGGPELKDKHLNAPLPDLKKLKPDLPEALVKVIEKMLAKKPEDRYQNCDELLKALEGLRKEGAGKAEVGGEPTQLGNYRIIKKYGQGRMGVAYAAEDMTLHRKACVFFLPREYANDPDFRQRFEAAAQAQSKLSHPNIVSVYAAGEDQGRLFCAREDVTGEAVSSLIKREKNVPLPQALDIVIQAASALKYAHDNGVIYRCIMDGDLVLVADGKIKLRGLVWAADRPDTPWGKSWMSFVSPAFISPEQLRKDKNVDGRTDQYSLGVVFWEMLAGDVPFNADTFEEYAEKQKNAPLPDLRKLRPDLPDALVKVIEKMLAKKPEERYQNCEELLKALEGVRH